ncbi:MAG: serine hydrolase, partial [Burkholderiales bacterium]
MMDALNKACRKTVRAENFILKLWFAAALAVAPTAMLAAEVYPAASWERLEDPAAAGWPQAGLDAVRARLANTHTTGFIAISGGRVLIEYGDVQSANVVASVRKSLLATLFGNYVTSGKIRLDKTLQDLGIDDIGGLSTTEKEATVRDLLSARSGIYHPASNPGDDSESAPARGSVSHGTYFLYNNWDFNALGAIFEK